MGLGLRFGQMGLSTKVSGAIIKPTERASSGMLMEMSTKENGMMIRQMDMVYMFM